ncbi:MAG: indole-3-glycerol phosphate synthase TrpC [Acidobacteria bacterium]|nr:indole-3-glycerol phosphate synthase TrpC [Acidobacteriota bacterium]
MVKGVPDILARIVERKNAERQEAKTAPGELELRAGQRLAGRRDFPAALLGRSPAIIAEIKQASPSRGVLSGDFAPARLASAYERGGAAALSVLTDRDFFRGSLDHLEEARAAAALPVLRKDFTLDEYHVLEAAAHGADAILLIAAILPERRLRELRELAARYRMAAVVEVHAGGELDAALASGAEIVGVNNRDLHTFQVTIETSLRLAARMPANVLKISESGIESRGQIAELQAAGYRGFLVGEHLMRSEDPAAAVRALIT